MLEPSAELQESLDALWKDIISSAEWTHRAKNLLKADNGLNASGFSLTSR